MKLALPVPLLAPLLAGLTACSSQIPTLRDWADSAIGQNVAVLRQLAKPPESYSSQIGWQEKTYTLANGHWVYVEPDRKNCEIHFEVNGEDIIVGYTPVGSGCMHQ